MTDPYDSILLWAAFAVMGVLALIVYVDRD
jgi:hypothetical protein